MSDDSIDDHQENVKFTLDYDAQLNVVNMTVDALLKELLYDAWEFLDLHDHAIQGREGFKRN